MRLDQALVADVGTALGSRPVLAFLGLEVVAGAVFLVRRGSEMLSTVVLIWLGMVTLALAHGSRGMLVWGSGAGEAAGLVLVAAVARFVVEGPAVPIGVAHVPAIA